MMTNKYPTVIDSMDNEQIDKELDFFDDDNLISLADNDVDDEIPAEWDLIKAFDTILVASHYQCGQLTDDPKSHSAMEFLKDKLQMNQIQVIIIAMLIDHGRAMSWADMARFMNITRLTMMTYSDDIEELVDKRRWLINKAIRERGERYEGFALVHGVIQALRHNKVFEPENITDLDEQTFVDRMASSIESCVHDDDLRFADTERWLDNLVNENMHLPLCQAYKHLEGDIHNRCLLLLFVADYSRFAGKPNEGLTLQNISSFFPEDWQCDCMCYYLKEQDHELFNKGYIENRCEDGMANTEAFVLTQKAKDELLPNYKPLSEKKGKADDRDLLRHDKIAAKELFYNANEGKQVESLKKILSQEQFTEIQQRLSDKGMRTGIAVLLSGGPGTGKTETVRQLARETGRDLLMIDISEVKDKFVGESEKNTKAIFDRYKHLCKNSDVKPILFINECDAILGKRMENAEHSADKMENSMQNILLQALEDLDGVIICTTNLAQTLDAAFERRFLMKIEFDKPDTCVRARIWKSMLPTLSPSEANTLAENYPFSGGQCENVLRKATINEVITGLPTSFAQIDTFCKEENSLRHSTIPPIIGFAA